MTKAIDQVADTNHRRNTELVDSYSSAAPEPVESIQTILNSLPCIQCGGRGAIQTGEDDFDQCQFCGEIRFPFIERAEKRLSRLLVQAKLEELELFELASFIEGEPKRMIEYRIKALQSQLEGAAGVANAGPSVPTEVKRNGGEPSA